MQGTFVYDEHGIAVDYNCSCLFEHSSVCSEVRQAMCDWANGLGRVMRAKVGKRNLLMGEQADIELLATQRNGR